MNWLHRRCRRDYNMIREVAWQHLAELHERRRDIARTRGERDELAARLADADAAYTDARADADAARADHKRVLERYQLDAYRVEHANRMAADLERLERENARLRDEVMAAEADRGGFGGSLREKEET